MEVEKEMDLRHSAWCAVFISINLLRYFSSIDVAVVKGCRRAIAVNVCLIAAAFVQRFIFGCLSLNCCV